MNRRRIFVVAACIALIFVLAALIWVDINENQRITNLDTKVTNLETSVTNLGNKVTALESETWHFTGNYTLSSSAENVTFSTQGKAWRMTYIFNGTGIGIEFVYNLRVLDSNGNLVGGVDGVELYSLLNSGRGIVFIPEAQGTYSVEIIGLSGNFTISFEVDSYY